jgi:hypothetical protein
VASPYLSNSQNRHLLRLPNNDIDCGILDSKCAARYRGFEAFLLRHFHTMNCERDLKVGSGNSYHITYSKMKSEHGQFGRDKCLDFESQKLSPKKNGVCPDRSGNRCSR